MRNTWTDIIADGYCKVALSELGYWKCSVIDSFNDAADDDCISTLL